MVMRLRPAIEAGGVILAGLARRWGGTGPFLICILSLASAGVSAESPGPRSIPLCPGLTIVTAVQQPNGDYESIKTIESVDASEVRLKYSAEGVSSDFLGLSDAKLKKVTLHRTMLVKDLEGAKAYQQVYLENSDEKIPETTAIGISTAALRSLKSTGQTELSLSNAYGGLQLSADRAKSPNYYNYLQVAKLRSVGVERVAVLVNDAVIELPALHVQGESFGDKLELYVLDDEKNPLTLSFRIGIGAIKPLTADQKTLCKGFKGKAPPGMLGSGARCDMPNGGDRDTLRVVKIRARCNGPEDSLSGGGGPGPGSPPGGGGASAGASALEKALADRGTVDVYSIYFSFDSDTIRDESQPTLRDISEVLHRHPDWKLRVDGHTDSIGGTEYNLALSKRRSGAVKQALVKQHGIDPARLVTGGHGASQPKDTNDTLEGRARNRRVELTRTG